MSRISDFRWRRSRPLLVFALALLFAISTTTVAFGREILVQISSDPYHNKTSEHKTQVEPDTFAFGNTIVSTFQTGRFFNGGASNIGWATSKDGGGTWTHGFLPGTTPFATPPGPYARVSDAAVAYDARDKVWLISYLGLFPHGNGGEVDVLVSRSTDGGHTWSGPVGVNTSGHFNDKNWTTCDDTSSSPFYGNCYTEFDNASVGDQIQMSTSTDGGLTWGPAKTTANRDFGIGGQPLVQPGGTVIVPIVGFTTSRSQPFDMLSFSSTNGGASWSATTKISEVDFHIPQGIRSTIPLPSAEIDRSGKVYVVWEDCRFEKGCPADDLVLTTSTNGTTWSAVKRIPIDRVGSGADHFIPGLAVDRNSDGASAHLGLAYYYYPIANCQTGTCQLDVGFVSSTNGGASWSAKEKLAGPMGLQWLALTNQGYMVGDYISTSIVPGNDAASPVFAVARPPTGTGQTCNAQGTVCHEATFTTPEDVLLVLGGTITAGANEATYVPQKPIPVARTAN